jgi:predicted CopG family antitoxin
MSNNLTTIQLREEVKNALDRMKSNKETYEQLIINLMQIAEKQKREQEELMIEGCKEMAKDMIEICKEWEAVDNEGWPEWKP